MAGAAGTARAATHHDDLVELQAFDRAGLDFGATGCSTGGWGFAFTTGAGRRIADEYPRQWPVILGVVLLMFVTALPGGIVDGWRRLRKRGRAERPSNGGVEAASASTGAGTS